jgi:hypothetical protein
VSRCCEPPNSATRRLVPAAGRQLFSVRPVGRWRLAAAMATLALFGVAAPGARANEVSTIAGTGVQGFLRRGPAAAATLSTPTDVVVAPDRTIYSADAANFRIRRLSHAGTSTRSRATGTRIPCTRRSWRSMPRATCVASVLSAGPRGRRRNDWRGQPVAGMPRWIQPGNVAHRTLSRRMRLVGKSMDQKELLAGCQGRFSTLPRPCGVSVPVASISGFALGGEL